MRNRRKLITLKVQNQKKFVQHGRPVYVSDMFKTDGVITKRRKTDINVKSNHFCCDKFISFTI